MTHVETTECRKNPKERKANVKAKTCMLEKEWGQDTNVKEVLENKRDAGKMHRDKRETLSLKLFTVFFDYSEELHLKTG